MQRGNAALAEARATPPADTRTGLDRISDERDRQLVEDYAEFDDEEEVREAARKALDSTDPNAIRDFLERGEAEARQRARDKRNAADVENRQKIEALRGTGGPYFNAEVQRVLNGTARDRADFLAFGAEIARQRDKATEQNEQQRAAENRKRVEMLGRDRRTRGQTSRTGGARHRRRQGDRRVPGEGLSGRGAEGRRRPGRTREGAEGRPGGRGAAAQAGRERHPRRRGPYEADRRPRRRGPGPQELLQRHEGLAAAASRNADRLLAADRAGKRLSDYTGR